MVAGWGESGGMDWTLGTLGIFSAARNSGSTRIWKEHAQTHFQKVLMTSNQLPTYLEFWSDWFFFREV